MAEPGLKYAETTINGSVWGLNTLPSTKSLECFGVVLDLIGPGASHLVDLFNAITGGEESASALEGQISGEVLSKAVSAMTSKLDARTIGAIKALLTGLRKDAAPVNFDHEFSGNFGALPELVAFALEHNYQSFFGSALFASLAERAKRLVPVSHPGQSGE